MINQYAEKLKEVQKENSSSGTVTTGSSNNGASNTPSTGSASTQYKSSVFKNNAPNNNGTYTYFDLKQTAMQRGASTNSTIEEFNRLLEKRNEDEKSESTIHGMSDAEYAEYQKLMYEQYGIVLENGYNYGNFQNVAVAMGESCSQSVRFNSMCKAAQSYDSVLDLVLDAKLTAAIADIFNGDTDPNWNSLLSSGNSGRLLKEYGIKITKCADRQFCFSLVDDNGNVIQDSEGHLAQVYKNDYLLPDGQAQQNEIQVSAALDAMGFDCWSVLDLSPEEYAMVKELAQLDNSQLGTSSRFRGDDEYSIRQEVLGTYDKATNSWSKAKKQDNSAWVNGTYTDKVSGETTGAKKRYSQFKKERDAGYYRGKSGYNGVPSGLSGTSGSISGSNGNHSNSGVHGVGDNSTENGIEFSFKISVSKVRFNEIVEEIMADRNCNKKRATEIAEKYYKVEGSKENS